MNTIRRILGAICAVMLVASCGPVDEFPQRDNLERFGERTDMLTTTQKKARCDAIKSASEPKGITNPLVIAGVANHETQLAHCWSEATWACQGPTSSDCGGGPIIAGSADGPCSDQQGGLGMFQFDSGTYSQTLATYGDGIRSVSGNASKGADFIIDRVVMGCPNMPSFDSRAEGIRWLNSAKPGTSAFETYVDAITWCYNGCSPTGCSVFSTRRAEYKQHILDLQSLFGSAYWYSSSTSAAWMSPQRASKLSDSRLRAYVWSGTSLGMSHITQSAVGSTDFNTWTGAGGALGSNPTAAKNADGSQIVFARSSAGELVYWKSGTTWTSLGGNIIGTPAVGMNKDGTLQVFVHSATTGGLAWKKQTAPNGSWGIWNHEDGNVLDSPAVGRNTDGTLEVFVHSATTGGLARKAQVEPNGAFGIWHALNGNIIGSPAVAPQSDGALRVFVHSATTGGLAWIGEDAPSGNFGIWHHLDGNIVGSPAVGRNSNGTLIVYVKSAMDGGLAWIAQPSPNSDFGLWHHEGGSIDDDPTVVTDSQGQQWVFVHSASNDGLSFKVQLATNGYDFGIWHSLGGHLKSL